MEIDIERLKQYILRKKTSGDPKMNYSQLSKELGQPKDYISNLIYGRSKVGINLELIAKLDKIWGDATLYILEQKDRDTSTEVIEALLYVQNKLREVDLRVQILEKKQSR